jgi:hypothetical protein
MLKIQWDIKSGSEADFKANQEKLCQFVLNAEADKGSLV